MQYTTLQATPYDSGDYLATLCHEIGTPLSAIVGLSYVLSDSKCSQQKKSECAEMLRDSSQMLQELLRELLDSSKLNAGMMEIEASPFNLPRVINKAMHIIRLKAEEKNILIQPHIASDIPEVLIGDPLRIRQIVLNLLSNAVKFTESGQIALYVSAQNNSNGNCRITITVADSGIGMTEAEMKNVFNKYVQANASISRHHGGTGLGLFISRSLAQLMKGDITVKSRPGVGSHFTATLLLENMHETQLAYKAA